MMVINRIFNRQGLKLLAAMLLLQACNKELPEAVPIGPEPPADTESVLEKLNASEFSILKAAVEKASSFTSATGKLSDILGNPSGELTFFAPDNTAILRSFAALGLPADPSSLNFFRAGQLDSMLKAHIVGGTQLTIARINPVAPAFNMYLQSALVLAPPSASLPPGYRMPIFVGKQGTTGFVNNIPITQADIAASNGLLHKVAAVVLPPDKVMWQTIAGNAGGSYTYFKAAVIRADGGENPEGQFQKALSTLNANFTVLAPTNAAFEATLIRLIAQAAMEQQGIPEGAATLFATGLVNTFGVTIISDPASIPVYGALLASEITPELLQGVVAYHIVAQPGATPLGFRNFTVNFPTQATNQPTLVNTFVPTHPGLSFEMSNATTFTVKGVGNATPAKVVMSAPPSTTNDLNHLNGVIQRIDQVLLPQ